MNNIIIFSGGCFSGKTTVINKLKEKFPDKVIVLNELIRGNLYNTGKTIDELRSDPQLYLKTQYQIIQDKVNAESDIDMMYDNKIILIDRALTDSLFYFTFYTDKNHIFNHPTSASYMTRYYNSFITSLISFIKRSFNNCDAVYQFKPLSHDCDDLVNRPKQIDHLKYIESNMISALNKAYCPPNKLRQFAGIEEIENFITKLYYAM